jgi:hypothetical protein
MLPTGAGRRGYGFAVHAGLRNGTKLSPPRSLLRSALFVSADMLSRAFPTREYQRRYAELEVYGTR